MPSPDWTSHGEVAVAGQGELPHRPGLKELHDLGIRRGRAGDAGEQLEYQQEQEGQNQHIITAPVGLIFRFNVVTP